MIPVHTGLPGFPAPAPQGRRIIHIVAVAVFFLSVIQGTNGQIPRPYFHTEAFSVEQGLGHTVIGDFQSDKNGFVWLYTIGHLQLFDGINFVNMNHLLREEPMDGSFNFVFTDELFFINSQTLYHLDTDTYSHKLTSYLKLPSLNSNAKSYVILNENRDFLFITQWGTLLLKINKKTLTIEDTIPLIHEPLQLALLNNINPRAISPDNIEYVGKDFKLYSIDLKTKQTTEILQFSRIYDIVKISADSIITLDSSFLHIYTQKQRVDIPLPSAAIAFQSEQLMIDDDHTLLLAHAGNLYEFDLRTLQFTPMINEQVNDQLMHIKLRMMKKDRFGNYYLSLFNQGMLKLHPRNPGFNYIGSNSKKKNFAKSISGSDAQNLILMGTLEDGLFIFDTLGNLKKEIILTPDNVIQRTIRAILKLSETDFVILASNAFHLHVEGDDYRLDKIESFNPKHTSFYNQALMIPEQHKYFLSLRFGLAEFNVIPALTLTYHDHHPINGAFAGTPFNDGFMTGIAGELKSFNRDLTQELATWSIPNYGYQRCMIQYSPTSILLGTDIGLYQMEFSGDSIIPKRIYDKLVYAILPGNQPGEIWFSTDYGLFELSPNGKLTNYSREIGLQENEFNTNCSYKSPSGKLYFGGINGITTFYPSEVTETSDSIESYVSAFAVNNEIKARYLPAAHHVQYILSPKENNLMIDLLAWGNKSPLSYNYQYKMEGLTKDWVDMQRNSKINFHLKSGSYTFYYYIADSFNPQALPTGSISIHILKPFYYRWWFISGICLSLFSLVLYLISLNRKKQLMKIRYENKLSQKLQNERMRISRELHDNIGAQMATVKRNINFLINQHDALEQKQVLEKMKNLEGISTQINQELRDTIWATQQEHISVLNFIARLKNYIFQTLGAESSIRVHYVEQCDKDVVLGPFLALNLHRICQEAINNVVKHAGASEIKVSFEGKGEQFKVTVQDNGHGFDLQGTHPGYGLTNIRQRAHVIGAALQYSSSKENGTVLAINFRRLESSNHSVDL